MKRTPVVLLCVAIPVVILAANKQPSSNPTNDTSSLSSVKPKTFDADGIFDNVLADREVIKQDFAETDKLMVALRGDKENLAAATEVNDAVADVLERTAYEGWLLEMYNHITNDQAREDAQKLMRGHYAFLATMTAFSVKSVHMVAQDCKLKELCALAPKVERDVQKIADRYQALSKD